jgi:hypothetical protein
MVKRPSLRLQRTSNRLYTFCTCVSGPDPDRNVWKGGGGRRHLYNRLYNGVNIHELIHFYSWGGGGMRGQDRKNMGGGAGVCNYGKI